MGRSKLMTGDCRTRPFIGVASFWLSADVDSTDGDCARVRAEAAKKASAAKASATRLLNRERFGMVFSTPRLEKLSALRLSAFNFSFVLAFNSRLQRPAFSNREAGR